MAYLTFGPAEFFGSVVFMPFLIYLAVVLLEGIGWIFREPFYFRY